MSSLYNVVTYPINLVMYPVKWFNQTPQEPYQEQLARYKKGEQNFDVNQVNTTLSALMLKFDWNVTALPADVTEYYNIFKGHVTKLTFHPYYFTHPNAKEILERVHQVFANCPALKSIATQHDKTIDKHYQRPGYIWSYPSVYDEKVVCEFYRKINSTLSINSPQTITEVSITHQVSVNVFAAIAASLGDIIHHLEISVEPPTNETEQKLVRVLEEFPSLRYLSLSADLRDCHIRTLVKGSPEIEKLDICDNVQLTRQSLIEVSKLRKLAELSVRCLGNALENINLLEGVSLPSSLRTLCLGSDPAIFNVFHLSYLTKAVTNELTSLFLENVRLDSVELPLLTHFEALEYLYIQTENIHSDGKLISKLSTTLPKIKGLSLVNCLFQSEEIADLKGFKFLEVVILGNFPGCHRLQQAVTLLKESNPHLKNLEAIIEPYASTV